MSGIFSQADKSIRNTWFALISALSFLSVITILFFACASIAGNFNDPLVDSADIGDIGLVEKLLKQGQLPDSKGDFGTTALMRAAFRGNTDLIKLLVDSGAFINAADSGGETALHLAAKNGHEEAVKALLYYGAFIDIPDKEQWTPLMRATMAKQPEVVKELIAKGADVTAVNNINESVLVHAAISGVPDIAAMILGSPKASKISREQENIAISMAKRKNNDKIESVISKFMENGSKEPNAQLAQNSLKEKLPEPGIPDIKEPEKKYKISENKELPFVPVKKTSKSEIPVQEKNLYDPLKNMDKVKPIEEVKPVDTILPKTPLAKDSANIAESTFFIQLGTFKDDHSAEVAWDKVLASSSDIIGKLDPVIVEAHLSTDPKDVVYRLRAGTMSNKNDADINCKSLRTRNVQCYVVEITNVTLPPSSSANKQMASSIPVQSSSKQPENLEASPVNKINIPSTTAMQSGAFAGSYPKLGAGAMMDSTPLDITPKEYAANDNLSKQTIAEQSPLNPKMQQSKVSSPSSQQADQQQSLPWLSDGAPVRKTWELPEETAATTPESAPRNIVENNYPEVSNIPQNAPAPYPATNNTPALPSQSQAPLLPKTQPYGNLAASPQKKAVISSYDKSFVENKEEIRNEIQNMKRDEFFSKQGVIPPKREKKEYDDFYKQIKNSSKDTSVSEAVMVPDETYFSGSKPSANSSGGGSNWLNIYNLPSEVFANDYGIRMFKSDESLGNLQVIVKPAASGPAAGVTMRVGPLSAAKAGELCGNVRAGGFGCSVIGDGDAGSPAAMGAPTKLFSSEQQEEVPLEKKSNFQLFWINLGTFPSNSEAEYYWMFVKENNADILNSLQYNIEKSRDQFDKSVKLLTGPFNAKQRATQICSIMRYKNIACLVNE